MANDRNNRGANTRPSSLNTRKRENENIKYLNDKPKKDFSSVTLKNNNTPSVVLPKKNTVTDNVKQMAKERGLSQAQLNDLVKKSDAIDRQKAYAQYRDAEKTKISRGNLDMGVEDMSAEKKNADKSQEDIKKAVKKQYGISDEQFRKEYYDFDKNESNLEAIKKVAKDRKFAEDHKILGSLKSLATKNFGGFAEGVANQVASLQSGLDEKIGLDNDQRELNQKDFLMANESDALREGATKDMGALGKGAYNLGMGAADMGVQALTTALTGGGGALMGLMQGSQISNEATRDSLNRGNSTLQAGLEGLGKGGITYGLTKFGVDNIIKADPKTLGQAVLKGMVSEGSEEALENILGSGVDKGLSALLGGTSQVQEARNNYMAQGLTEEEAKSQVLKDRTKEVLQDAGAGALFGGVLGGIEGFNNYTSNNPYVDSLITENNAKPNSNTEVATNVKPNVETNQNVNVNAEPNLDPDINVEENINNQNVNAEEVINNTNAEQPNLNTEENVQTEQPTDGEYKQRSYTQSVDLPEDFKAQFADTDMYKVLTNEETISKATDILNNSKDVYDAENQFRSLLREKDPSSVPLGYELAKQFIDNNDMDRADDIVRSISEEMTKAGQFTQAAYITALRNNPMAVLTSIEKDFKRMNTEGAKQYGKKWKGFELTADEKAELANCKIGDSATLNDITNRIYKRISNDMPHSMWEKFYDLSKTCMLLNPRTHLRNTVANAVTLPVRSMTDRVKAVMEFGYSKINKDYERTSSFTGTNKVFDKKYIDGAEKIFEQIQDVFDDNGKWNGSEVVKTNPSGLNRVRRESQLYKDTVVGKAFKKGAETPIATLNDSFLGRLANKYTDGKLQELVDNYDEVMPGSLLEDIRQFDYWLLGDVEDMPFVKTNFVNSIANYMKAQKITDPSEVPDTAISMAISEALKATFKDDNAFTKFLSGAKASEFNKKTHLIDIAMPFTKTPANLAMRGIDYSPVGFINSFRDFFKTKRANGGEVSNADISNFLGDLSKNITGSAMIYVGYLLAKKGLITGDYSDNKNEKKFQQMQGYQPNAFHIGNYYYTYDWSQPSSIPLLIGTAIYEGMSADDKETNKAIKIAKSLGKGMINSADAWFNLSPLQNLAELMGGGDSASYGDSSPAMNVFNTMAEYPQSLIPSVMGATARANDTTIRNTFDKTSWGNTYLNKAKAKIPGLSETLPASYDTWGRERKRSSDDMAAFSQFVNPGTLGYYDDSNKDIDDYIQNLFDATKKETVFPKASEYSVDIGEEGNKTTKKLNNVEYSERQKMQGQKSAELVRAFKDMVGKTDLTNEEQAEIVNKLYGAANDYTKQKLYDSTSNMSKAEAEAFEKGPKAYAEYQRDFMMAKRYDMDYSTYTKKMSEGGVKAVEEYAQNKVNAKEINEATGSDIDANDYQTYASRGATKEDIVFLQTMKLYNKEHKQEGVSDRSMTLSYLTNQNMSDAERSKYLRYTMTEDDLDAKYIQRGFNSFGESALYQILYHYNNAKAFDGNPNGSPSFKETQEYVKQAFGTKEEQEAWLNVIFESKSKKTKK